MKEVLVDMENGEILNQRNWCISALGYVVGRNKETNKVEYLHRVIMGNPKGLCIDHINGNKLDNRKCNLRICSKGDNLRNTFKRNGQYSSTYKGVHFDKNRNKWKAEITVDYKNKHLGRFDNAVDAAIAYNNAALIHFGEFAQLNKI